jgi:hypothetical protein
MTTIYTSSNSDNKDYDNGNVKYWSYSYLVDNIFNNLMSPDNKYIIQARTKLPYFRIKSPVTFFDIYNDFKEDTKKDIELYVKDCKSHEQAYQKLDGIITEVIALIYRQARPLILSTLEHEDPVWVERTINEIRSTLSYRWRFV